MGNHIQCENLYERKGQVPSNSLQNDSLRSKSMGMYHALIIMEQLINKYHCTQEITLASDNLELIKRTEQYNQYGNRFPKTSTAPHMDIQSEIDFMIKQHFPNIKIVHVSGHQDTKKNIILTWMETLNVRADKLATLARTTHRPLSTSYQSVSFPHSNIQLYINGIPIHKWMNPSIHQAVTTDAFINHIKNRFDWNSNLYKDIDWTTKTNTMKRTTVNLHPWLIKLSTDRLPLLGEKFTQSHTSLCPMCNLRKETPHHFLTCSYYKTDTENLNKQLIQIMNKVRMDPYLRILLSRIIERKYCNVYNILQAHPKYPINDYKLLLLSQKKWMGKFFKRVPKIPVG